MNYNKLVINLKQARIDCLKAGKRVMHDGWAITARAVANSFTHEDKARFLQDIGVNEPYDDTMKVSTRFVYYKPPMSKISPKSIFSEKGIKE